jgi:tetratricopeptide (TPR) repeat protein
MRSTVLALLLVATLPLPAADDAAKDRWTRLRTPEFELSTSAGEKTGKETLLQFDQVRGFFLRIWPEQSPREAPLRIVVFKTREQFTPYTAHPTDAAYFTSTPRGDYIVMADPSPESYNIAVHEFFHLIVRRSGLKIPTWLNEGLAEVYSTLRPVHGGVAVGDLIPQRMEALGGKWLTFETLTSVDGKSPIYSEGDRVGVFYGESWALAHMLFLAPEYSPNFPKFVNALNAGKTSAEACRIAFGRSSEQVFDDLRNYFGRKRIYGTIFETGLGKAGAKPAVTTLPAFETRLMLADLLLAIHRFDDARRELVQLEQQQPARPEPDESLGFLAGQQQDREGARHYFEKAFAAGEADPRICFELAVLERDAKQPPETFIPMLERAVNKKPDYTEALVQLGLAQARARQYESAIATLLGIHDVKKEQATPLFTGLAYAYLQTGDLASARKYVETARKWALNAQETHDLDQLGGLIDARSSGPFAPQPGEKLQRVQGSLQAVECSPGHARLRLSVEKYSMVFDLPPARAVEFSRVSGEGTTLTLACGPHRPLSLAVDYAPSSAVQQGTAGVVRKLEW